MVVLDAANLKSLPAVQLPRQHLLVALRPQHLAVGAARGFWVEACLEAAVVCLEVAVAYLEVAADATAAAVDAIAAAVDAIAAAVDVTAAAVEAYLAVAVADLVGGLDSVPFPLALQKPSTTKSFLSGPTVCMAVDVCGPPRDASQNSRLLSKKFRLASSNSNKRCLELQSNHVTERLSAAC